ncbi:MAG: acylphosphatase [Nitrososphaeria archaeon]
MIRAEIIVNGEVQRVGYRDFAQKVARKLDIKGYVENLRDGSVKIVCESDEDKMKEFVEELKAEVGLIKVVNAQIAKTSPATGEFQYFEIKYGPFEEELSERMVAAVNYAAAMWDDIKEMKGDIKTVIKKQDETISEIRTLREDLTSYMNKRFEKIEREIEEIKIKVGMK